MTDDRLASALQDGLAERATVPPELIYWRAQLDARREREDAAARPIAVVQWAALGCLCALGVAFSPAWWMAALFVAGMAAVALVVLATA